MDAGSQAVHRVVGQGNGFLEDRKMYGKERRYIYLSIYLFFYLAFSLYIYPTWVGSEGKDYQDRSKYLTSPVLKGRATRTGPNI